MINRDEVVYKVVDTKLVYTIKEREFVFENSCEADNWLNSTSMEDIDIIIENEESNDE